jgi:hypothetical protein
LDRIRQNLQGHVPVLRRACFALGANAHSQEACVNPARKTSKPRRPLIISGDLQLDAQVPRWEIDLVAPGLTSTLHEDARETEDGPYTTAPEQKRVAR